MQNMEGAAGLEASQLAYELKRIREKVPVRLDVEPVDEIPTFEVVAHKILPRVPRKQTELVKQTIEAVLPSLKTEVEREAIKAQFGIILGGMTMRSSQRRELSAQCYHYSLSHFRQRGLEDRLFISLADAMLELSSLGRDGSSTQADDKPVQITGVSPRQHLAPYQLPPSVSLLVGRSENIRQLNELTGKVDVELTNTVVITAISGAGGIGKTALAVCWAHQVSSKFPDGQLFANLHGYDFAQPTTPADALEHFLRSLGVAPEQIPDDLEQRAALYRTALHGRRMLIVLDNASGTEQVRPLLPGTPECFVLITSRSNLAGLTTRHGAKRITIGRLHSDEGIELLSRVIGRHRVDEEIDAAMKLVEICDGLPLALVIVCDQANSRPRASLQVLVEGLSSQETRFDSLRVPDDPSVNVQNVFEWSYRLLGSKQAHLFRLLGLHAGPTFYVESAAALLGANDVKASVLVQDLCSYHLIEERDDVEFEFHDLLRDYARAVCKRDETAEDTMHAVKREMAWYLNSALHGSQWIMPQRKELTLPEECKRIDPPRWSDYQAALEWCERERVNMLHAIQQAHEQQMYEFAWKLPVALRGFYNLRKHWSDWLLNPRGGTRRGSASG